MNDRIMSRRTFLIAGASFSALCMGAALSGCAPARALGGEQQAGDAAAPASADGEHTATLHRGYAAAHGDKCFTQVVVATAEDGTILAASVDDYQYMAADAAGVVAVPNSDGAFAEGYAEGMVLASKSFSNESYSANMAEKAGSTQPWLTSMQAIEASTVGKQPSELEHAGVDAVSGATLVDTPNYLAAVASIAQNDDVIAKGTYTGDGSDLELGMILAAAHGDKCFTSAIALVQGGTIVAASIDDFQYMAAGTEGVEPVPNSDAGFGEGAAEGKVLVSKSVNSPVYSKSLKEKGGATQDWITSIDAIEDYLVGMSIASAKAPSVDAVSGATLVDTANYAQAAIDAAKAV